jgi:cytochrome b561
MCGHSSHNITMYVFYLIYQLHVSAIVNSAIIRSDTTVRETIQYNVIQYNLQYQCK